MSAGTYNASNESQAQSDVHALVCLKTQPTFNKYACFFKHWITQFYIDTHIFYSNEGE